MDATDRYDEIRVLLFNHGTESIGLAGAEDWHALRPAPARSAS
ncbi:hypothetical protein [Streptomyces sp. NPDC127197]